jgi:hypothetical protein
MKTTKILIFYLAAYRCSGPFWPLYCLSFLRFMACVYPFGIFKLFLWFFYETYMQFIFVVHQAIFVVYQADFCCTPGYFCCTPGYFCCTPGWFLLYTCLFLLYIRLFLLYTWLIFVVHQAISVVNTSIKIYSYPDRYNISKSNIIKTISKKKVVYREALKQNV